MRTNAAARQDKTRTIKLSPEARSGVKSPGPQCRATYRDDALYRQGLEVVDRAIARAPGGRLVVSDPNLQMHTADELRAELQRGRARDLSDLNPMKVFAERK